MGRDKRDGNRTRRHAPRNGVLRNFRGPVRLTLAHPHASWSMQHTTLLGPGPLRFPRSGRSSPPPTHVRSGSQKGAVAALLLLRQTCGSARLAVRPFLAIDVVLIGLGRVLSSFCLLAGRDRSGDGVITLNRRQLASALPRMDTPIRSSPAIIPQATMDRFAAASFRTAPAALLARRRKAALNAPARRGAEDGEGCGQCDFVRARRRRRRGLPGRTGSAAVC